MYITHEMIKKNIVANQLILRSTSRFKNLTSSPTLRIDLKLLVAKRTHLKHANKERQRNHKLRVMKKKYAGEMLNN